ncbi:50S ribosomal protein L4 [Candidatus Uhrbacteria bacterium]|nr:50S ribosomal protein L4 [Candidatus Uhrbacteria bacterium]
MPKVIVYNQEGAKTGEMELSAAHFGVKVNPELVHEMVVAQQANARKATGHTKTKGEVHGGGKKPWRQKGTGRARQGSTRNPHWVGGGVAHGPRNERNFGVKVNRKAKRQALFMALSDKVSDGKFLVLEPPTFTEPKTKLAAAMLKALPLGRRTLLVLPASDPSFLRMVRNLQDVKLVTVNALNLVDIVNAPTILFQKDAVPAFEKLYGAV